MRVALAVIDVQRGRGVVGLRIRGIERRQRRRRTGRVQVELLSDLGSGLGCLAGSLDTQVAAHAGLQQPLRIGGVALQLVAIVIDDETVLVGTEVTCPGVLDGAVVAGHEEAVAIDAHVQGILGGVDGALVEQLPNVAQQHTATLSILAGAQYGGRIQILELRP